MRRLVLLTAALLLAFVPCLASHVAVGSAGEDLTVRLLESGDRRIVLEFEVGGFEQVPVEIDGQTYYRILLGEESNMLEKGLPDLPNICRSVIIPDDARMEVRVTDAVYEDLRIPVAPSKGSLSRSVNPADVPYTFDDFYAGNTWFPAEGTAAREPYILRDFRGLTVVANPFRYNPETGMLRVYTRMTVELENVGPGVVNVLTRHHRDAMQSDFRKIYDDHFLNFGAEATKNRYPAVDEVGEMIVIAYSSFVSSVQPLVDWKNRMGMKTTLVDVATIGNNSTSIKSYIQNAFDTGDLAFVLLVGDAAQVAYPTSSGYASDPSYSLLAGSDHYPDIFVGRFSAETTAQVETQVERTIAYERDPEAGGDWYHKGLGVASNQGTGDDGEYDDEHIDNIRADLLAFTYTEVDRIYDPTGTASQVSAALNNGRSVINYCGHGSSTSWGSTGFSNTHINALVNDDMLPFIVSVACLNGSYTSTTCFAEAWMRATNGSNPTGAIGIYASSKSQDWNPPMAAQDETTDLLVAESKRTFGALCFLGSCQMMDEYANGPIEFDCWHVFGDPSLRVRTDTPASLSASHASTIDQIATTFTVNVTGVEGALCGLYHNGTYHGSAFTNASGQAVIDVEGTLPDNQDIDLTVTYFNRTPYFGSVHVGPALYPTCDVTPEDFFVVMGPDETHTEYLTIANNGDPGSVLTYSLEKMDEIPVFRNISGSTFTSNPTEYTSGATFDIVFSITCVSGDSEWIKYASLDFPSGVTVNSSTDFVVPGTSRAMYTDNATGNGATINWAGDGTWGEIYPGETGTATVNVTVGALAGDMQIPWTMDGDIYGSEPHHLEGTIVLASTGPSIVLTAPIGGEIWGIGESHDITWTSSGDIGDVEIHYSVNGGGAWNPVTTGTTDDGLFEWLVPAPKSQNCLVRVAGLTETVADTSDAPFTIYQPVYWFDLVPENGTVDEGDEDVVEVRFDTSGMPDGEYYATIIVHNSAGGDQYVPVILQVQSTTVDPDLSTVEANDHVMLAPDGSGDSTLTIT
ncbi:MAG: hypothetical protein JW958_14160, partial [Candidatus Eisenbacteria bacterium]|nr:hypothetical protein [Candidatus Eisenbacteria bacterium]